ncbi:hypothetical protein KBX06_21635 [Micromonospora sp. C31]|uniref:hypothetical protein n=1 Tax=Micromonospora sp. C31 TaxID=2824876 RepID=UPI001B37890D|nr:hypothetical protein [Micromonospora sp. C31]MBQ1075739.1 hypothetical protein [Micromonospora sp. C31]
MGAGRGVSLATVLLLAGCTTAGQPAAPAAAPQSAPPTGAPSAAAPGCGSQVETGPLPDWADAGFSGSTRMPHVLGASGEIVAVLFGHPLTRVRRNGTNNKILWVARPTTTNPAVAAGGPLRITATLHGSGARVTREVAGGPGPSIVDLPQAGCWRFELRWSGRTDVMDLVYGDS